MPNKIQDSVGAAIVASDEKWKGRSAKYLANLRYRLRKAPEACAYGSCKALAVVGRKMCETHLAYKRAYMAKWKGGRKNG